MRSAEEPGAEWRVPSALRADGDRAELSALVQRLAHRRGHGRVTMAKQQRAMPAEVVDIAVAIDVPFVRPRRALQ